MSEYKNGQIFPEDIKTVLVTGGCGFIGSHVVEHIHRKTHWKIIVIDKLTYASKGFDRLRDANLFNSKRTTVLPWDLCNPLSEGLKREIGEVDVIIHMAAETHVDRSVLDPVNFTMNNITSTLNILEYARKCKDLKRFFYFSTDEVFGSASDEVSFKEWDCHKPGNPYSASKSASEQICIGYSTTYKVPLLIVNVMNAYGERQNVEKFIPKCIKMIRDNEEIQIHAHPNCEKAGSRSYIHARNIAEAVLFLMSQGKNGEKYNIGGEKEVNNLDMAKFIANVMGKDLKYNLINYHESRPYHDLRYALNGDKMIKMGWKLPSTFEESLRKTIKWTMANQNWLE
jgi:dTDP-glucose 4,6-dehydratase